MMEQKVDWLRPVLNLLLVGKEMMGVPRLMTRGGVALGKCSGPDSSRSDAGNDLWGVASDFAVLLSISIVMLSARVL